ncbi:MAG: alkaline phosphatase D family protein [Burkholderiales bacterium]
MPDFVVDPSLDGAAESTPGRRRRALVAIGAGLAMPMLARAAAGARLAENPFTLGVASGYPHPGGMVLWTRLAPRPVEPGGGMPAAPVPVEYMVAEDDAMRRVVSRGTATARPEGAHAVHVETDGLQPGRWYWYRFTAGGWSSPIGRTRTAPPSEADAGGLTLNLAVASCQQYEAGYYAAYRQIAEDAPDLVVHLGDYIYEGGAGPSAVRRIPEPVPMTLEEYRIRHARYRLDPDLQRAHAACPWLLTWDDHEVENDYASSRSQNDDPPGWFMERRAAAYRAYYEHMPLPRRMLPMGPYMRLHTEVWHGRLARFFMLDGRQYRTPQACTPPGRGGGVATDPARCAELHDPARTYLGLQQRDWLLMRLPVRPEARWNLLCQQTLMQPAGLTWQGLPWVHTDGWDGYPAERSRLLAALADARVANPVVLGGDVHAFYACALKQDDADPNSPAVASEFVCGAITSPLPSARFVQRVAETHPAVRYTHTDKRGYLRLRINATSLNAEVMGVADVRRADSPVEVQARLEVTAGRVGPVVV